jgi:hypothetical protein
MVLYHSHGYYLPTPLKYITSKSKVQLDHFSCMKTHMYESAEWHACKRFDYKPYLCTLMLNRMYPNRSIQFSFSWTSPVNKSGSTLRCFNVFPFQHLHLGEVLRATKANNPILEVERIFLDLWCTNYLVFQNPQKL